MHIDDHSLCIIVHKPGGYLTCGSVDSKLFSVLTPQIMRNAMLALHNTPSQTEFLASYSTLGLIIGLMCLFDSSNRLDRLRCGEVSQQPH